MSLKRRIRIISVLMAHARKWGYDPIEVATYWTERTPKDTADEDFAAYDATLLAFPARWGRG